MASSNKFTYITDRLSTFLDRENIYTLAVDKVDFSDVLKNIIQQLQDTTLSITKAAVTTADDPPAATWAVSGDAADWPVPGLKSGTATVDGSTVTLTVTDEGQDDSGQDKEPGYQLVFSGNVDLGGSHPTPVTLTLANSNTTEAITESVVIGDGTGQQALSLGSLVPKIEIGDGGLVGVFKTIGSLFSLDDAQLITGTLNFGFDANDPTKPATVSDGSIVGSVTFAGLSVGLMVKFTANDVEHPDITLIWPPTTDPADCTIGALLSGLGAPFTLPDALDVTVHTFSMAYVPITDTNDQLNPNDTWRLVLSSPADVGDPDFIPDFLITWSFDAGGALRTVVRANWDKVSLSSVPIIGDHLPATLQPLVMLLLTQPTTLGDVVALAKMDAFPGLETLGVPSDQVKQTMAVGIYCAMLFSVGKAVSIATYFPLYVLDAPPSAASADSAPSEAPADPAPSEELSPSKTTTSVAVQQNIGPVHLDSVGYRFENDEISILYNVGLGSGGLQFELVGLRESFNVSDRSVSVGIDGLMASFASGGVSIAGGFVHDATDAGTDWVGTAIVRIGETFALQAAAAFDDTDPQKMFLFCYEKEQIGGPPWLTITGLALGFGFNRAFTPPAADEVDDFPFVAIANSVARGNPPNDGNPLDPQALWDLMSGIETYIAPSDGTDFLTAGFTALSFGFINSTVLASIVFGSKVEFVALGSAVMDVPPGAPVAHAELEVVASVDPDAGLIAVDGVLAPGSYVLSKACHLTGGFAVQLWFAGAHQGDFVYTFGGFSPTHPPPKHYPKVPRLGYIWKVSDEVLITGWSYFALTPGSVQAGGGLNISLSAGPLSAWCNASCDFYIQWMPFFYQVDASVDVGVSFRMSLLFCTVTVSADIGADLYIWGPDFSGHADIDLWFVSFGIDFGAGASSTPNPVALTDFVSNVLPPPPQPASQSNAMLVRDATGGDPPATSQQQPLQIIAVNGTSNPPAGSGVDWIADPSRLVLSVATAMPAANVTHNGNAINDSSGQPLQPLTIYAKPVGTADSPVLINPMLAVTTAAADGSTSTWQGVPGQTQVPSTLYGDPSASEDIQLVPGLVALTLTVKADPPDQTVPIDQSILLDDTMFTEALGWQAPSIPQDQDFSWDSDNPFKTISDPTVTKNRSGILKVMQDAGYLDAAAIAGIDLEFIVATQQCFVDQPVLCLLGADQKS